MSNVLIPHISYTIALGAEKGLPFTVRTAGPSDIKFIDALQKRFRNEIGFLPKCALEEHLAKNRISIGFENDEPAGYILAKEHYDGDPRNCILYQCAIEYSAQRHLLGSSLLEHAISLMPAGTQRASAWVAQDIEANYFWEACGFSPIAARRGSKRKGRVHIFWQRVLERNADRTAAPRGIQTGGTPAPPKHVQFQIPGETRGGLMRERRVVLPIEKGEEWREFSPEDFPEPAAPLPEGRERHQETPGKASRHRGTKKQPRECVAELRRRFITAAQDWMWVIINGVGRYLPTASEIDVPEFMDQPGPRSGVLVGAEAAGCAIPGVMPGAIPSSRIPGVG